MSRRQVSAASRLSFVSALTLLASLAVPRLALAEADDAAETAAARTLAVDGVKLAQASDCAAAVDKLERAEKLKHSPIVLRHLGECQVKVGRLVEGSESLRKLLREPLPEGATPILTQAYESAAITLREVKPRIPSMKLVVSAPADAELTLKIDGKNVAASVVGVALPTDPGEHNVELTAPGFLKAVASVTLDPGASSTVNLELKRDPNFHPVAKTAPKSAPGAAPRDVSASATPAEAPVEHGSRTGKALGYVSYGVAAVGLGVGIAFGQSAMSDEKNLRSSCPNKVCAPDRQDALDFAQTKGTVSTIGFAVAGGGVVLGTVLLITSADPSPPARAAAPLKRKTAQLSRPRALIGPTGVAFAADF